MGLSHTVPTPPEHGGESLLARGQFLGNRYEIRRPLGRGGMGEVWLAYDLRLRVEVALKILLGHASNPELLHREVRAAREVMSPNVCRIFDLVEADKLELVSMEFVDGVTLRSLLDERSPLDIADAHDIAIGFLTGLEAIHEAGLIHRDFKPENVMITRAGRVVVMDFGLARAETRTPVSFAGTRPYMAPEQMLGVAIDRRADVFAAGVVLAEMIHPAGVREVGSRVSLWTSVHQQPPRVEDSPWSSIVRGALAHNPDERFASAVKLARALEESARRFGAAREQSPYPGLASFNESDTEYFFGRETEIESMWRKLAGPARLLALIGPSGAGKSSFLRAGLIPAKSDGCGVILSTPGRRPFLSLARAFAEELSGDAVAMIAGLTQLDEVDEAVRMIAGWRQRHDAAILIVDQFEELFTLNSAETQRKFADLLARIAIEADVHVLLSMRDDFLIQCRDHPSLTPLFSDLTALVAPTGDDLCRAIVQPAIKCGYRFEDERLIDGIRTQISGERGALPLAAFAMARLWEKRDRQNGVLTRAAYEDIGGVAGALAQHAEAVLEQIGADYVGLVRDLFRNLVTAQGTRAARSREELLSIFPVREKGNEILTALIDARLLTSYELDANESRIEIIHESLLTAWPRLVRWQAQDADGALLRDHLRQSAQVWSERSRPDDLLWSGSAYQEFSVWRARYDGKLSRGEEEFAAAMVSRAEQRKRKTRLTVAAVVIVAVIVAGVTSALWRQARNDALGAEAAELLALGRLRLEDNPTTALAYALASLERADSPAARRFAVETLSRGAPAFRFPGMHSLDFSADGQWLASATETAEGVWLWSRDGSKSRHPPGTGGADLVQFGMQGKRLLVSNSRGFQILSIPEMRTFHKRSVAQHAVSGLGGDRIITVTGESPAWTLYSSPIDGGKAELIGRWEIKGLSSDGDISRNGEWLAYSIGPAIYIRSLRDWSSLPRRLGEHRSTVKWVSFETAGDRLVSLDEAGEVRIWSTSREGRVSFSSHRVQTGMTLLKMDARGVTLVTGGREALTTGVVASIRDLSGPPDADARVLRNADVRAVISIAMHPSGRWVATASDFGGILWPIRRSEPYVLREQPGPNHEVVFTPDGKWLASASREGTVRLWPLSPATALQHKVLLNDTEGLFGLAANPNGKNLLATKRTSPSSTEARRTAFLIPLDGGGSPRTLPRSALGPLEYPAFSADGSMAAANARGFVDSNAIELWDLRSGTHRALKTRIGDERCGWSNQFADQDFEVEFTSDGGLVAASATGLRLWNLEKETTTLLKPCRYFTTARLAGSRVDRFLLLEVDKSFSSTLSVHDLRNRTSWAIESHGSDVSSVALDRNGTIAVTGSSDGLVRIGPIDGKEPHLLYGHRDAVASVAVSPDHRWIASASRDGTIRLWPMPDLSKPPLHTLPYDELLTKLRSFTNVRVVKDETKGSGYKIEIGPFPGWAKVPEW